MSRERDELSSEALELLQGARRPRPRTPSQRARTGERVAQIAIGLGVASTWWVRAAWAGAVGAIGVAAVLGVVLTRHAPASHPAVHRAARVLSVTAPPVVQPAVQAVAAPVPPSPVRPVVPPSSGAAVPPRVARVVEHPVRTVPAGTAASGAAPHGGSGVMAGAAPPVREDQCLASAAALVSTDPSGAVHMTEQCARMFPNGGLAAERDLVVIDALRRMGREEEARARGVVFLQRYPDSIYAERVRHIVGVVP